MERRVRIVVVMTMLVALGGLLMLGSEPEIDLTVDELMESPESHEDQTFRIRGAIQTSNHTASTLILTGQNSTVMVDYSDIVLPTGATDGKTVSVRGSFTFIDNQWVMTAHEIKTGCPSKYEADEGN